jgi:hypothetical protein
MTLGLDKAALLTCVLTTAFWRNNMQTFFYKQTVEYMLKVQAETEAEADAIALATDIDDIGVIAMQTGWEEDGYADA